MNWEMFVIGCFVGFVLVLIVGFVLLLLTRERN